MIPIKKSLYFHLLLSLLIGVVALGNSYYSFCDILQCRTYYNATISQFVLVAFSLIYLGWVLLALMRHWLSSHHHKKDDLVLSLENKIYDVQSKDI